MTITGAGSATTIVDGGQATGVFGVRAAQVAISGLTVRNGKVAGANAAGAGIANDGTLSLLDVAIIGGSAPNGIGGGIASDVGNEVTLITCAGRYTPATGYDHRLVVRARRMA
jgi:hypothetical protein